MRPTTFLPLFAAFSVLVFGGCASDLARRVSQYKKTRDYEAARSLLERAVKKDPNNAEAQFLLGKLYLREDSYAKARKALVASREASPKYTEKINFLLKKNVREEFQKGKKAVQAGAYAEAAQYFLHAAQLQPSNATAFRARGHALIKAKQPRAAEKAYLNAYEQEGTQKHLETLNNLASLAYQREAYSRVIKYSKQALDRRQTEPEVVKRLAYTYLHIGQFAEAQTRFRQALNLDPSPELRRDYALLLYNQGQYEKALPLLRQLSEGEDPAKNLLQALAESYFALEQYRDAAETYVQLHKRRPKDVDVLQNLVITYEQLENQEKAETYRTRLLNVRSGANE